DDRQHRDVGGRSIEGERLQPFALRAQRSATADAAERGGAPALRAGEYTPRRSSDVTIVNTGMSAGGRSRSSGSNRSLCARSAAPPLTMLSAPAPRRCAPASTRPDALQM